MESIRAPRTYYPGELIYQDKVFARALHREKKDKQCEFCHKSSDDLIPCNKCNVYAYVKYCGTECQVKFSSLDLTTNVYEDFCFGVDQFQQECIPNANIEICDDVVKVWAVKQIVKSEKITISRIPLLNYYLMRSPLTEDNLRECKCTECSLPYGESLLTKVIDRKKAYDAIWISEKAISITGTLSKLQLTDDLRVKHLVNKALEKQEGYLGPTHSLRLKLLTIRGMMLHGEAILMNKDLLELEKNMTMIFGEYYLEMRRVYQSLTYTYIGLKDPLKAAVYSEKKENVKILRPQ